MSLDLNALGSRYHVATLIDQLKADDAALRIASMREVPLIAQTLGPERTRDELIPFIAEGVDDDDEVLLVMAEVMCADLIPYLGGEEYATVMFSCLEALASVEESSVRDRAVASINTIVQVLPLDVLMSDVWKLVCRLGEGHWFTSRCAAIGILPTLISRFSAPDATLNPSYKFNVNAEGNTPEVLKSRDPAIRMFVQLAGTKDSPIIRRQAARVLPEFVCALACGSLPLRGRDGAQPTPFLSNPSAFALAAGSQVEIGDVDASVVPPGVPAPILLDNVNKAYGCFVASVVFPIVKNISSDLQDSVRILAPNGLVALAQVIQPDSSPEAANYHSSIIKLISSISVDKSWRVRWSLVNRLSELATNFDTESVAQCLYPILKKAASDNEVEVRTAAAYRVLDIGYGLRNHQITQQGEIMTIAEELMEDIADTVRSALASVVFNLALFIGKQLTMHLLVPILLRMLKDPSPQVRLNAISQLQAIHQVVGLANLSNAIIPAIGELGSDKLWRVREAVISFMPLLAQLLGADHFQVQSELLQLSTSWLQDSVFSVRKAAAENLKHLSELFGPEWVDAVLFVKLSNMFQSVMEHRDNQSCPYVQRTTAMMTLSIISLSLSDALLAKLAMPLFEAFSHDPVPNVRFGVAKALENIILNGKEPLTDSTRDMVSFLLTSLKRDEDYDVRFYAEKAWSALE